jgi:hypothetical protein
MDRVFGCHGGTMSAQRFPMRAAYTAASQARFSSWLLLLPLDTVLDFCRLDRSDGNGFAP